MSGHSKWHNIQAKKGKADAARGKIFTKLGREILIAVKQGGPDPAGNSKLKDVISKCKANNMPNDTINNAIKKASGATDTSNYEEITYEGYGTNGVAVIVEASTDNRNRTAADVRHVFDKAGGNLGTTGCVSYLFNKKGIIVIDKESTNMEEDELMMLALDAGAEDFSSDENCYEITTEPSDFSAVREALEEESTNMEEDELMMLALDAGAEDFSSDENCYEITTEPSDFSAVREALEEANLEFVEAEVQMIPTTYVSLNEEDGEKMQSGEKMQRLIDKLEDLDDVMNVYHNWEE